MQSNQPLPDRVRPKVLEEYYGQRHIIGEKGALYKNVMAGTLPSMILWGPPGVGKTTLALLIAQKLERPFYQLSAVHSGVKDVRETIESAKGQQFFGKPSPILFIDEIHRFSKSQQDSLLAAVEKGIVTLIGATTENPSFEVISPLLSRCQVYVLQPLSDDELVKIAQHALKQDFLLKQVKIDLIEYEAFIRVSGGDARKLLNAIELVVNALLAEGNLSLTVTNEKVHDLIQQNLAMYDKQGEQHYDIVSAFIKSIRGSDPNAAVYWLARMLAGGEDLEFIARRMLILSAEDIGLANPNALLLANTCFQAIHNIGMPEARIILSETAIYLATSPKANSAYLAIDEALDIVKQTGDLPVPLHLRNSPTKLMKNLGYGKNYQYAHDFPGNFIDQEFLPDEISGKSIYKPQKNTREAETYKYLSNCWKGKYG